MAQPSEQARAMSKESDGSALMHLRMANESLHLSHSTCVLLAACYRLVTGNYYCQTAIQAVRSFSFIRDRGSDLYVGIDMVKNYCLYKWYGSCSAKKGQKLSQITPN